MPLDIRERVTEDEMQSLRKRVPGEVALEILASLHEQSLIVWYNNSRWGTPVEFLSTRTMEKAQVLDGVRMTRAKDSMVALFKRGYIQQVDTDKAKSDLNHLAQTNGNNVVYGESHREGVRTLPTPWRYGAEIFIITQDGKDALAGIHTRLNKIRAKAQELKDKPQFVVSRRVNNQGVLLPGIGSIYRLVKITSSRVIVKEPEPEDGIPDKEARDYALLYDGSTFKDSHYLYLEKNKVALMNATAQQWAELKSATAEFDQRVAEAREEIEALIAPIKNRFLEKCSVETSLLETIIYNLDQRNREQSHLQEVEEDVVTMNDDDLPSEFKI